MKISDLLSKYEHDIHIERLKLNHCFTKADKPPSTLTKYIQQNPSVRFSYQQERIKDTDYKNIDGEDRTTGNENFKNKTATHEYDSYLIQEFKKCAADPIYFSQYCCVISPDDGLIKIRLRPYQKEVMTTAHENRNSIFTLSRQIGKTTCIAIYIAWFITFHRHKKCGVLAQDKDQAQEIIDRISLIIEMLPDFLQAGLVSKSANQLELETGSSLQAFSSKPQAIRGKSFSLVYLDEAAFHNEFESVLTALKPVISAGRNTKVIMTSTPNGMNAYHELWRRSLDKETSFATYYADWRCVQERLYNKYGKFDNGKEWKRFEISDTSEKAFKIEHEAKFLGSAETLISPNILEQLEHSDYEIMNLGRFKAKVFEEADDLTQYVIAVDPSEGVNLDYTVAHVIDRKANKIVCTLRDNTIDVSEAPYLLMRLSEYYNDAFIVCELNSVGGEIVRRLLEQEFENLFYEQSSRVARHGVLITPSVKKLGCQLLKVMIESGFRLRCEQTINELKRFVTDGKKFSCQSGNDDTVMALVNYAYALNNNNFIELLESDDSHLSSDSCYPAAYLLTDGQYSRGYQYEDGFGLIHS